MVNSEGSSNASSSSSEVQTKVNICFNFMDDILYRNPYPINPA